MTEKFALRDKVLRNLAARGDAGAKWLDDLPVLVRQLEGNWGVEVGRTFSNATEAYVAEAVSADGTRVVLKIPIVGVAKGDREARMLAAASGEGYVRLLRHDPKSGAMLLERLGPQLAQQGFVVDKQIEILCETLQRAWRPLPPRLHLTTGAEKAREMSAYMAITWEKTGKPCSERTLAVARDFADRRARGFDPETSVMAHGDAHAWNTLLDEKSGQYKFVDPDGFYIERAHDLSISLRESCAEALAGNAIELGRARCALLSRLTGVDGQAIWEWGVIETLANGLSYEDVGSKEDAAQFLAVAEAWADAHG
jgi:streptomycin 6-kinase